MGIPCPKEPQIRIYLWFQSTSGEPYDHCSPEQAAGLVDRKLARRRHGGFSIQLREPRGPKRKKFLQIVIHGTSCKMGPRVTEEAADGSPTAQAAAEGYIAIFAGSYCPLILAAWFASQQNEPPVAEAQKENHVA